MAYLLPGFIVLVGMALPFPKMGEWLRSVNRGGLNVGAAVFALMAAMTFGMILSCVRWLLIDGLHRHTGVVPPTWNDSRLEGRLEAFDYLVEAHYRYYQFYANTLVAIAFAYGVNRFMQTLPLLGVGTDLAAVILCAVLFVGSRDALAKYYARTSRLVGKIAEKGSAGDAMTNGNDHGGGNSGPSPSSRCDSKPGAKPPVSAKAPQQSGAKVAPPRK